MSISFGYSNEVMASEAFSKQALLFDKLYGDNKIIQYKRQRVRDHILKNLGSKSSSMLELNCGTGEDALFFAAQGHEVHATDISSGMLDVLRKKIQSNSLKNKISIEECSFTQLEFLKRGTFDYVYSNFGGLNCTNELEKVLRSLDGLTNPGAVITLVVISRFCLWETLLLFKGKFKTAFRRFFSNRGRRARVEGSFFKCWYYSPILIKKYLGDQFECIGIEGLCTIVPPSYIENFAEKRPRLFDFLRKKEDSLKSTWPWRQMGDYFIISFRKKLN
jgi:ubiquinone/menaquinone biosynthesis C-methylase UbiE